MRGPLSRTPERDGVRDEGSSYHRGMDVRLHEGLLCAKVGGRIPKVCLLCGATKEIVRRRQEYAVGASYGAGAGAAGGVIGAVVASQLRHVDRGLAAMLLVGIVVVVSIVAMLAHRASPKVELELPLCQACDARWAEGLSYRTWILLAVGVFFVLVVVGMALDAMLLLGLGMLVLFGVLAWAWASGQRERFVQVGWVQASEVGLRLKDEIARAVIERAEKNVERRARKAAEAGLAEGEPEPALPLAGEGGGADDAGDA